MISYLMSLNFSIIIFFKRKSATDIYSILIDCQNYFGVVFLRLKNKEKKVKINSHTIWMINTYYLIQFHDSLIHFVQIIYCVKLPSCSGTIFPILLASVLYLGYKQIVAFHCQQQDN